MSKLIDSSILITKGTTPTTIGASFKKSGINFIKSESITNSKFLNSSIFEHIDDETNEKLKRSKIFENDLLISIAGAYLGKLGIVRKCDTPANTNQAVGIVRLDQSKMDVNFVYYYLSQREMNLYINKLSSQSGQPNLNLELLGNLEIKDLELYEQKKIAKVLSFIDDKIELNNKVNSELEAMAKEIYDYRFVQFDFPDENGKPYKSSGGSMVWNDELKREIPEGWEVKKIKNVIQHINTGLNPRQNFKLNDGGNIKYITVKNLTADGTLDFDGCDLITKESKDMINQRSQIREGDILFASIAPLGRCYLMYETPTEWEINESVFSIRNNDFVSPEYLYMYFMSKEFVKKAEHSSTGSVFSGIRIGTLEGINILTPSKNIMNKFSEKAKSIYSMKKNIEKQNHQLSELRDFLLPMLMNGQVTVK